MPATLVAVMGTQVKVEVTVELSRSLLETEEAIQTALNQVGCLVTREALQYLDTDGSPVVMGADVWRTKGRQPKAYQTPYGEVVVERHVYQRSGGGKTYCPLERDARIVVTSTPRFAKQVTAKFGVGAAREVQRDLADNHSRTVAASYLQRVAEAVGTVVQVKETTWEYALPALEAPITTVAVGLDGTCMLLSEDGYREAMTGTISLYDAAGERHHTIYLGAPPEYGKSRFLARLTAEVQRIKGHYLQATYVGIADGAEDNWRFLRQHTSVQVLDFYHAAGYLEGAGQALFPKAAEAAQRAAWVEERCHRLKHEVGAAAALLAELQSLPPTLPPTARGDSLDRAVTYFYNHHTQMNYPQALENHWPIGSGVTEAACKTLVKQRLCRSGMRWKNTGAAVVLSLRALLLTPLRWEQFWDKLDQYGFPVAA